MNKRIKQLAEQAGLNMWVNGNNEVEFSENEKKFAELIVRECAEIARLNTREDSKVYLMIQEHFGVDE